MDALSRKGVLLVSDRDFGGGCGEGVNKQPQKTHSKKKNQTNQVLLYFK